MKSNLTTQERFSTIESVGVPRSTFDRSYGHKTTIDAGKLYPLFWDLAIPGDTFSVKPTIFGRFATPLKPVMDNVYVDVHFFSVPYRLVYKNFKKLMGEQDKPSDSTNFTIPQMIPLADGEKLGYDEGSIYDYFGLPTKTANWRHSSLPLRAYNLIWNEWYRDENLQDPVEFNLGDEIDDETDYSLLPRNKRKDYFTSALPWAQKAQPVAIPLVGKLPVYGTENDKPTLFQSSGDFTETGYFQKGSGTTVSVQDGAIGIFNGEKMKLASKEFYENQLGDHEPPYADMTEASAITVNAFREAVALQQFFELDARGGTRYTETIKAHFNVTSPDARLQRPEYLGGGSAPLTINPIAQQSASADGSTPQGNLAGIGTISMSQNGFTKTFTEHEIILGMVSVRADITYQQGLNRMWSQKTRFDFYWPSFANLGEQAILNKELMATSDPEYNDGVFGYQERFAEYRYRPSQISGLFRSNANQSLDVWHLSQEFEGEPALNSDFIIENPPIERVIAVPSEPQFILDCFFDVNAARPMPVRSTPGLTRL